MGLTKAQKEAKLEKIRSDFLEIAEDFVDTGSVCCFEEQKAEVSLKLLKYIKYVLLPDLSKVDFNSHLIVSQTIYFEELGDCVNSSIYNNKDLVKGLKKKLKNKTPIKEKVQTKSVKLNKKPLTLKLSMLGYRKIKPFVVEKPKLIKRKGKQNETAYH
jgi:hypothetical protein